jgi:glycosyltransferase involved in cell wall biosynthesis
MTRVLINHFSPIPNKITGISVYTWRIVEALAKNGSNQYVLSTNWDIANLPLSIRSLGLETIQRNPPINETLSAVRSTFELPNLLREKGCSAVFHPQPTSMMAGLKNSVIVIHDLYRVTHSHLFNWKQRAQWNHVVARGLKGAGRLIAVSEATRAATIQAYPDVASKISVVHEASPISYTEAATTSDAPDDRPYALMVANVTPNKNIKLLIDALKLLADRGEKPLVYLIGRDENGVLPSLIGGADLNLVQLGTASDETLQQFYAHARVYLNTSLVEGFCLPLLEAHTYGVPVICSDLPVLREVAGEGAIFVATHQAEGMAAALSRVFKEDDLRNSLSEKAKENVQRFSWKKAAVETEAVINEVAQ